MYWLRSRLITDACLILDTLITLMLTLMTVQGESWTFLSCPGRSLVEPHMTHVEPHMTSLPPIRYRFWVTKNKDRQYYFPISINSLHPQHLSQIPSLNVFLGEPKITITAICCAPSTSDILKLHKQSA